MAFGERTAAALGGLVGAGIEVLLKYAAGAGDRKVARAAARLRAASLSGNTERFLSLATEFVDRNPRLPDGYAAKAEALLRSGRLDDALDAVRLAERLGLNEMLGHLLRAAIHRDAKRPADAIEEFTALIGSEIPEVRQYGLLGRAGLLAGTGDRRLALRDLDAAVANLPDSDTYRRRASILRTMRLTPEAILDLGEALALSRDAADRRSLLRSRAALYDVLGRAELARKDRTAAEAIVLPPPSPVSTNRSRYRRGRIAAVAVGMLLIVALILGFCFRADLFPPPSVPVGNHPRAVAASPDGRWVYVANEGSGTVSIIDTASNAVVATIPVGPNPRHAAVTPDGTRLYVVCANDPGVVVIDTATRRVRTTTIGGFDDGLAISPDGRWAYVLEFGWMGPGSGRMAVLDTSNDLLVKTIALDEAAESVTVAPDGRHVYVTHFFPNLVSVIDTATNSVVRTIKTKTGPSGAAISPDGRFLYVGGIEAVSVVETATNALAGTIDDDRMLNQVAISADGSRLYAIGDDSTKLAVIDPASRRVIDSVQLGKGPTAMAVTPDGRRVYVADFVAGSVSILDTSTNSVIDPG